VINIMVGRFGELASLSKWKSLLRPGDWLVLAASLAGVIVLFPLLWTGGHADRAIIRRDGELVAEVALSTLRRIDVPGPIGTTVIEVQPGRARVLSDPGPRQYCVQQGWLARANAVAICAPNHVSLTLAGPALGGNRHDSINY
jgi:hypothetical protein